MYDVIIGVSTGSLNIRHFWDLSQYFFKISLKIRLEITRKLQNTGFLFLDINEAYKVFVKNSAPSWAMETAARML